MRGFLGPGWSPNWNGFARATSFTIVEHANSYLVLLADRDGRVDAAMTLRAPTLAAALERADIILRGDPNAWTAELWHERRLVGSCSKAHG